MKPFEFSPVLFEIRNAVLEALLAEGFEWRSDFGSVDSFHDVNGLEVCGIHEKSDARSIQKLLRRLCPNWQYTHSYYKDHDSREPGWKVVISRDQEDFNDDWQSVG